MSGGPEGEHQPTEEEQKIIDAQMPGGSERAKASAEREEWMLAAETSDPEVIQGVEAMSEVSNHYATNFGGRVKEHRIEVSRRRTEFSGDIYKGEIDGAELNPSDAETLFNRVVAIRGGVEKDQQNIAAVEVDDKSKLSKDGVDGIFESK